MALVEEPPPSGFLGDGELSYDGPLEIVTDDPEHVVIRLSAPQRGFLLLADQYFPGWYATVNGTPATILRANFLFRASRSRPGIRSSSSATGRPASASAR